MSSSNRLQYRPAIDGLRAVAVAVVVLFHGGWSIFSGGYVGVSLFFTLSGFLITSLLLRELESTSTIALRVFYARRLKRLMPASLGCLFVVSLLAWRGFFVGVEGLRGDIASAVLQVFNWRSLSRGQSYADLIGASRPGPIDHFWSLSIEEQFYWIWPIAMLWIWKGTAQHEHVDQIRSKVIYIATGVAMVSTPIIARIWGANAVYWATPARFGEILVGASLALWLTRNSQAERFKSRGSYIGFAGLSVVLASAMTWPSGSGPAYVGLFPILAIASAAAVVGATCDGVFGNALSIRPLVWLGQRSYGIYLVHWPVFVVINGDRFSVDKGILFAVRVAATLAIAGVLFAVIEQPIRRGALSFRPTFMIAGGVSVAVLIGVFVVVPDPAPLFASDVDAGVVSITYRPKADNKIDRDDQSEPVDVVVLGDSTALALSAGIISWAKADLTRARVAVVARDACGFARAKSIEDDTGNFRRDCDEAVGPNLDEALALHPTLAVMMVGLADSGPLIWDDSEGVLQPDDARYAEHVKHDYRQLITRLVADGVTKIEWVLAPPPTSWWLGNLGHSPESLRTDLTNQWITDLAGESAKLIHLIRLDQWLVEFEKSGDRYWRPDGLHLSEVAARQVVDDLIGPILLTK